MAPKAGFVAKIRVNGQVFSGAHWSIRESAAAIDVSNTEGTPGNAAATGVVGKASKIPNVQDVTVTVGNASIDPSENPFIAPRAVTIGSYAVVQIYPFGLGDKSWYFPSALVTGSNYSGQARGPQPVEFTFEGDGIWNEPII